MANITTCPECGDLYEAGSEEQANEPGRLCRRCWAALVLPDPRHWPPPPLSDAQQRAAELLAGVWDARRRPPSGKA
jgi:hypothetical protein